MLPKGLLKEYSHIISFIVRSIDMCTIFLSGYLAYILRFDLYKVAPSYLTAMIIGFFVTSMVFSSLNIYNSVRGESFFKHAFKLCQAIIWLALLLAGLAFFTKVGEIYSRTWFFYWMTLSLIILLLFRTSILLFLRYMRTKGVNERRVVIYGLGEIGIKLAQNVQEALWTGYKIVRFIDETGVKQLDAINIHDIPVISKPHDIGEFLVKESIDEIWLSLPLSAEAKVKEILYQLRHHTITTRFVLDIFSLDLLNHSITDIAGFPVLNIRSTPMTGINRLVKALEDRFFALIILLVISPLFLLISIVIKLTSQGPVLFKQRRLGWDGKIIKVYKFRTMVLHDEGRKVTQARANDARVTKVGRFLRRTSLDELPQFINVLQGRMSIVGPRPHALAHNEFYKDLVPIYMQRHRVKPGITGWAQVNGWRGETDTINKMQKRVEYDLFYINNWSLGFDLKIIFLTLIKGFINRNAY